MNLESIDLGIFVLFCIGFLVIGAIITRAVFSIPTILTYYKANTLLLTKIARQQGVSEEEIEDVLDLIHPRLGIYTKDFNIRQIHEGKHKENNSQNKNS